MKVRIVKLERERDSKLHCLRIHMEATVTDEHIEPLREKANALVYLGNSNTPVEAHLTALELVRFASHDELMALSREIQAELMERRLF